MYAPPQSIPSWKFTSYLEWTWNRGYLHGARSLRDVLRCVSPDLARRISSLHEQKDEESGAKGNVLQDQRFVLEDEGFGQQGGDGVMFGAGLEHQALVSRYDVLLQLLDCPLPWERRTHRGESQTAIGDERASRTPLSYILYVHRAGLICKSNSFAGRFFFHTDRLLKGVILCHKV